MILEFFPKTMKSLVTYTLVFPVPSTASSGGFCQSWVLQSAGSVWAVLLPLTLQSRSVCEESGAEAVPQKRQSPPEVYFP